MMDLRDNWKGWGPRDSLGSQPLCFQECPTKHWIVLFELRGWCLTDCETTASNNPHSISGKVGRDCNVYLETINTLEAVMRAMFVAMPIFPFALVTALSAGAQSFDQLASQYKTFDIECQNNGVHCEKRDQLGEQLMSMGGYLCGRRDWYASAEKARAAGCR